MKIEVGDIFNINLNPTKGEEKSKTRPCIILQNQVTPLKLVTVLPITEDTGRRSEVFFVTIQNYREVGLKKPSVVDCYQIRTVSIDRLSENKLGNAVELVDDIKTKLANILEITEEHVIIDEPDITDGSREVRNNLLPDHSPDKPEPKSNIE